MFLLFTFQDKSVKIYPMKTILVTGGAGYIGSHTIRELKKASYRPVIFDNLSTGHQSSF